MIFARTLDSSPAVDLSPAAGSAQTVNFALAQSFLQAWNLLAPVSDAVCPILKRRSPVAVAVDSHLAVDLALGVDLLQAWNAAPGFLESQISVKRPPAVAVPRLRCFLQHGCD